MRFSLLFVLGMLPLAMTSQTFEVSGSVRDTDGKSLPYANVMLLQVPDSTQVKGISADDNGKFSLKGIEPNVYYLQAKYFGYLSLLVPLEIKSNLQIGALVLEPIEQNLSEVVVTGTKPIVERKADRIVFNVENTVLGEGNSWDILRNAPGVIVMQDNLEIRGQAATVYLNDRKVQLSAREVQEFLKGLSGDMISSVEVIPNPPASFEAGDGSILNIRTKENVTPGYKGNVRGQYTQGVFPKYSFGTSHYFKNDKVGIFLNYTINPRKEFKSGDGRVNFINDQNEVFASWNTDIGETIRSQDQQFNLMFDYKPSERDLINFTSNISFSPNKEIVNELSTEMLNGAGVLDSTMQTLSPIDEDLVNLSFDLNYERKLKKEGENLKANVHYTYYDLARLQRGSSDYFDPSDTFLRNFTFATDAMQDINIFTARVDYYLPLESGSFETGIRGSWINTDSGIDYFDVNNNLPPFDIALSDNFEYREGVYALYGSYSHDWEKWALKLGLRAEQTNVEALSVTLLQINKQNYFELFPSFYLSRKLGEENSLTFDYSRKINRPKYSDLNPFRYFLNENNYLEGNPNLVPNFSHNFNLNYSIKDTYFFDVYYRDNGRYISTLTFQDNENQVLRESKQNVQKSTSYGLDFTISTAINDFWSLYFYNSVFYEDETLLAEESTIETYTNKVTGYYGYLNNTFSLSKDGTFTGDLSFSYLSNFLFGSYKVSEIAILNVGLRKTLWNNRGVISLVGEDLLGMARGRLTSRYANQDNSLRERPETRFVRLGFTYKFGNYRLNNINRNLRKSELQRLENE
ncbi:outer membrane beta-barrel family protein [uncultured Eudoraea sp.]|uniref:outer membrane beta-barrel family protein n=1 Tax=uncultured Eudoraea sp. TaxID=1035614 RepID=UPI002624C55E|nr:outer membrane beta-barrel family protein [uncultured Eudoraea sp.]